MQTIQTPHLPATSSRDASSGEVQFMNCAKKFTITIPLFVFCVRKYNRHVQGYQKEVQLTNLTRMSSGTFLGLSQSALADE